MIYSLEGTPGVGKSLYMVSKLIPDYLKIRGPNGTYCPVHIFSTIDGLKPWVILALQNLPDSLEIYFHNIGEFPDPETGEIKYNVDYARYFYLQPHSIKWLTGYDSKRKCEYRYPDPETKEYIPINSLVLLDEVQNIFDSHCYDEHYAEELRQYITKHRHWGHQIFWASQNVEQVLIAFRRNTEQVWFLEKMDNFKLVGGSQCFKISQYEGKYAGNAIGVAPYATQTVSKDKRYYKAYRSHFSEDVKEKSHSRNMFLHNKPFMIMSIILIACVLLVVLRGNPFTKSVIIAGKRNAPATANAKPAPSMGFTPMGAAGGGVEVDSLAQCYTSEFRLSGVDYVVINGKAQPKEKGVEYVVCN